MDSVKEKPVLLIVEDSPEDFELIRRGLRDIGLDADLRHCLNGDDALDFLHKSDTYADVPSPTMIILDLNLPGTDGREVLEDMQKNRRLAAIPTIVFSNSSNINDINACYSLGANSFVAKPLGPQAFALVMRSLRDYWLGLVRLPDYSAFS